MQVLPEYESLVSKDEDERSSIILSSEKGRPEIIVLEKFRKR